MIMSKIIMEENILYADKNKLLQCDQGKICIVKCTVLTLRHLFDSETMLCH
jgi:hypothetical protein